MKSNFLAIASTTVLGLGALSVTIKLAQNHQIEQRHAYSMKWLREFQSDPNFSNKLQNDAVLKTQHDYHVGIVRSMTAELQGQLDDKIQKLADLERRLDELK